MAHTTTRSAGMPLSAQETRRRRRELILMGVIILMVALLTLIETRIIQFGSDIPVSNTILMFILININLLLLILLIFLVFRNLVKLVYDRRRKVMGSKLRTRLVVAFMALTLLPTGVLFFFSLNFITSSIEFWFNVPVEQSFENSLWVGRQLYQREERIHQFYLKQIIAQLDQKNILATADPDSLQDYAGQMRNKHHFQAFEIYAGALRGTGGLGVKYSPLHYDPKWSRLRFLLEASEFSRRRVIRGRDFDKPRYDAGLEFEASRYISAGVRVNDLLEVKRVNYTARVMFEDKDIAYLLGLASLSSVGVKSSGN